MINFHRIVVFPLICASVSGVALSGHATVGPGPDFRPVSFTGNVAAVQATGLGGDTRIFYQNADNSIQQIGINGPFTVGAFTGGGVLVPANQVLPGTPIAATLINGDAFQEMHLFFISPNNTLSSYIWQNATKVFRGGPSCWDCLTASQFAVQPGSKVLYVMGNSAEGSNAVLRVGFISAGQPGTLTEVDWTAAKGWQQASLP
ncbi:hypothetical protein DFH06DRAFT_1139320 [Mycena polygramma]|nr:hypothetical protein DFH06DRAFT_1139320 [Mycena polygramma]